uniref:Uncharacterized protein n=1 Tax=Lutzomyia longipalpis TaxID=7200 RepID=A0A1B0CS80_LUTLO
MIESRARNSYHSTKSSQAEAIASSMYVWLRSGTNTKARKFIQTMAEEEPERFFAIFHKNPNIKAIVSTIAR